MITEDYCSFEVAKLLKEKGFDIPCDNYYDSSGKTPNESVYGGVNIETLDYNADPFVKSGFPKFKTFSAPTHQMVMKWLRCVYKLHITISPYFEEEPILDKPIPNFKYSHYICKENEFWDVAAPVTGFDTYEHACEAAIKYCLTNLIK